MMTSHDVIIVVHVMDDVTPNMTSCDIISGLGSVRAGFPAGWKQLLLPVHRGLLGIRLGVWVGDA